MPMIPRRLARDFTQHKIPFYKNLKKSSCEVKSSIVLIFSFRKALRVLICFVLIFKKAALMTGMLYLKKKNLNDFYIINNFDR